YVYANSNPINFSDPTGKLFGWDTVIAFIAGAIIGGVASIISQAISGKGINWAKVGYDAVIGGVTVAIIDTIGPEGIVAKAVIGGIVGGIGGGVQGAGDYCIEKCGTTSFSWKGFTTSTELGAITGGVFGALDLGEGVVHGVGEGLTRLSSSIENEVISEFIYRLGTSIIKDEQIIGAIPLGVVEGVVGGIQGRPNLNDTLNERLKQFNASGASS
ncbi:MAG TPA: hypothetical protein VIZ18_02765, partial [Ktedonobacteraceae bacterium]